MILAFKLTLEQAVARLRDGEPLVFPTETFFGLGCKATDHGAVSRVARCKTRPEDKPLPVVAGSVEQLGVLSEGFPELARQNCLEALAARFWPGPLAVLLPARKELPLPLQGDTGHVAVRVCGHPLARRLCLEVGEPLVATSANQAGAPPAARVARLDPDLVRAAGGYVYQEPDPMGGLPSTIVAILEKGSLRVVREGVVPSTALSELGFRVA
ncbi:MAG: L-threonylcarbamoyladenylate synthase [Oceanidesulfovibrio sp.]